MHISEIIKFQFEKECHTLLYILKLFTNIRELALKNARLPLIFFLDFNNTYEDLHSSIITHRGKNFVN